MFQPLRWYPWEPNQEVTVHSNRDDRLMGIPRSVQLSWVNLAFDQPQCSKVARRQDFYLFGCWDCLILEEKKKEIKKEKKEKKDRNKQANKKEKGSEQGILTWPLAPGDRGCGVTNNYMPWPSFRFKLYFLITKLLQNRSKPIQERKIQR